MATSSSEIESTTSYRDLSPSASPLTSVGELLCQVCLSLSLSLCQQFTPHSNWCRTARTATHVQKLNDVINKRNDVIETSAATPPAEDDQTQLQPDVPPSAASSASPPLSPLSPSPSPSPLKPAPKVDPSPLGAIAMREYDITLEEVTNQRQSLLRRRREPASLAHRQPSRLDHSMSQSRGSPPVVMVTQRETVCAGRVRRLSRGGDEEKQLETSLSLSSSGWRLRRQAIQVCDWIM